MGFWNNLKSAANKFVTDATAHKSYSRRQEEAQELNDNIQGMKDAANQAADKARNAYLDAVEPEINNERDTTQAKLDRGRAALEKEQQRKENREAWKERWNNRFTKAREGAKNTRDNIKAGLQSANDSIAKTADKARNAYLDAVEPEINNERDTWEAKLDRGQAALRREQQRKENREAWKERWSNRFSNARENLKSGVQSIREGVSDGVTQASSYLSAKKDDFIAYRNDTSKAAENGERIGAKVAELTDKGRRQVQNIGRTVKDIPSAYKKTFDKMFDQGTKAFDTAVGDHTATGTDTPQFTKEERKYYKASHQTNEQLNKRVAKARIIGQKYQGFFDDVKAEHQPEQDGQNNYIGGAGSGKNVKQNHLGGIQ
jgi:hypothetical protein